MCCCVNLTTLKDFQFAQKLMEEQGFSIVFYFILLSCFAWSVSTDDEIFHYSLLP